jgi:hypothetical protein
MEEWFHDNNLKEEVNSANSLVAETLELLHTCFPQWDKDGNEEGQGWSVSKFHGITKFVLYIKPFGNAIDFYGGIGESNHKKFVKETRCNTQKRNQTSTSQVVQRYHEGMTLDIARKAMDLQSNSNENNHELSHQEYNEEKSITVLG